MSWLESKLKFIYTSLIERMISLTSIVGSCIIDSAASNEFSTSSRIEVYKDFPIAQKEENVEKYVYVH